MSEGGALDEHRWDVVIVGAGIAGCAAAVALARADTTGRRRILLLDRYQGVHPRFSGEFIHPRGTQILEDLGFLDALLAAGGVEADGFVVFESPDGRRVDLPYASLEGQRPRGLSIHHKVLVPAMRDVVRRYPAITLREGVAVEALVRDERGHIGGVMATELGSGACTAVHADLVVAADGKGSAVRKLAGIRDHRETVGFTLGLEVPDATLPAPTCAHVFLGAWGPILAYPILCEASGRVITRLTFDLPRELPAKGAALADWLLDAYVPFLPAPLAGEAAAALVRHRGRLEMAPTVNLPAPTAACPGLALVGDAAGCSHPITASGMTMGLRDAESLGSLARERADLRGEPWLDARCLRRYRAEHDRYVPTRQALADAIYEAFRGEHEGARAIRRAIFAYWESGAAARRRSMALLSCVERRPHVFLTEYLRTARHAITTGWVPRYASAFPWVDRAHRIQGAASLARQKLGMVTRVMWAQVRPTWMTRVGAEAR